MSDFVCNIPADHQKPDLINNIAVFGFADAPESSDLYKEAYTAAETLAKQGYLIVNGGGPGVMRAATDGAHAGGGKVVGVTFYPEDMTRYEGKDPENKVDSEIVTKNYVERTLKLLAQGQMYVIFNGGTGTISEFGMAWGLARLYFGHHKPMILYGQFWHQIVEAFRKNMHLREGDLTVFKIATSPHEVLTAICEFEREISEGKHVHLKISAEGEDSFTL